jgi:2-dehydro-3-deoxyphosphogluconate aldolase/(4S)-4-hydroxy-2-oxoglutarate aldolase
MASTVLQELLNAPIAPTVYPFSADILCSYARALKAEGFPLLEVLARPAEATFRVIQEINVRPERHLIHWGIGTILTESLARQAIALQPDFLVSPAFSRRVLHVAVQAGIPYIPGVCTFQDVQDVLEAFEAEGLRVQVLKLCPIEGITSDYVRMLGGCYPNIAFCPTGEVTLENLGAWKSTPYIAAPMGSLFVPETALEQRDFEAVRRHLRIIREVAEKGRSGQVNPVSAVVQTSTLPLSAAGN